MKMLEKVTEGAGIAMNYVAGVAMFWFGAGCTLLSLILWGLLGMGVPLGVFLGVFGLAPLGAGIWLFRRGRIQQQLFKVKLLKESVRKLAFRQQGRLRPAELAQAQGYSEDRALHILKNLAAEDPDRVELQLDYESGELYFEFTDILRAIEARKEYQALPISNTLSAKAVDIAKILGKTVETFYDYVEYAKNTTADQKKVEQYKRKVIEFVREIEELKQQ
jgi:hypothetical protein